MAVVCGLAGAGVLGALGGSANASYPGTNGLIICSGALALELGSPPTAPPGTSLLELFTVAPDATNTTRLMMNTNSDFSPRWSADGKKVAFVRDNQIHTMNADGSNQSAPLTSVANGQGTSNAFVGDWSPDGSKILFQSNRTGNNEVFVMNADGSNQVNLTNNAVAGANSDSQPAWSPDGTKISFTSNRDGNSNIHVANADGSNVVNITASSAAEESASRWSPDNKQIAFQTDRTTFPRPGIARNLEIFRMNADGSNPVQLTNSDYDPAEGPTTDNLTGFDLNPAWSPDMTRIVFHSGRAPEFRSTGSAGIIGQWEAYNIDANVGESASIVRVTNRAGNDERCDWQPILAAAPPPPPPPVGAVTPAPVFLHPSKMSVARATMDKQDKVLDVLAPISSLTSGRVSVDLDAAQSHTKFTTPIDAGKHWIKFRHPIPAKQADMGTGILTLTYNGDADTRPQTVRLRAAPNHADLAPTRPTYVDGRLKASGRISGDAEGVVRVQIQYVNNDKTTTLEFKAKISDGRWSLDEKLSTSEFAAIAQRTGTLHSYVLFTGYIKKNMRGEMRSYQVLAAR